ncbi:MAG: flagellar hook-length control protein FliK [Lentisphaerae bacterium]|nr:flagellar hook-length control protein FliK [Lentisphaerota bacterium]
MSAANDPASALPLAETGALPAVPAPPPPASSPTPPPSAETSLASAPGAEAGPAPVESAESSDGFRGDDFSPSGRQPVPTALELSGSEPVMNVPGEASAAPVATAAPVVPPGGPVPSTMPPAALLENLDRIVLHSVRGDPHSIRIELEPASLGRVMVHCRETSDGMSVEINVQNNGIRSLLTAQEQDLRLSLESQGYQMGRFSVSCRDGDGRPDADHAGRQPHPDLSEPEERRTRSGAPSVEAAATTNGAKSASRNRWVA